MTIFAITDIHGSVSYLHLIESELKAADWIFLGGDLTHFGGVPETLAVLNPIREINPNIFAIPGNCDKPEVDTYLGEENFGGHGRIFPAGSLIVLGVGGSLPAPFFTPNTFSESEYEAFFARIKTSFTSLPDILVSHQPPWGTRLDKVRGGKHVGSRSLRDFINLTTPSLVFCGHIHESSGVDMIGETRLVNPGPFRHGNFARIVFAGSEIEIELCQV